MAESAAIPYLSEDEAGSLVTLPMLLRAAERFFSGPERPPLREEASAGDFRRRTGGEDGQLEKGPDGPQPPGGQPAVPQAAAPHRLSWVRAGPAPERERL